MQAVQLEQLLPQIQTLNTTPQDLKTGDTRFIDELRSFSEKLNQNEKLESDGKKTAEKSDTGTQNQIAEKSDSNEEEFTKERANVYAFNPFFVQSSEETQDDNIVQVSFDLQPGSDETLQSISDSNLNWLFKNEIKSSEELDLNSDEFSELIASAQEFIPGIETEDELLSKAQNLSLQEPAKFLESLEQISVAAENSSESLVNSKIVEQKNLFEKENSALAKKTSKDQRIQVTDLRTLKVGEEKPDEALLKVRERKDINLSYRQDGKNSIQVTMDLAAHSEQNITSSSSQTAAANGSTFQSMISNAVVQNVPDFVKAGSIVLKDNNQGSINLVLYPEKLGNVKINLSLSDKVISGQITVHSKEAFEAIKESLVALKTEFARSGFETGEFNLNFSDSQQSFAQSENQGQNQQASFRAERNYGDYVALSAPEKDASGIYSELSDYSVNIVA